MFEVIIFACLVNEPATCKKFHYEMIGNGQMPMQCLQAAQEKIKDNLPRGYKVEKFSCKKTNKDIANI